MLSSAAHNLALKVVRSGIVVKQPYSKHLASIASDASLNNIGNSHRVVVVAAGAAGLAVSHQLLRSGRFRAGDIAVVEPAEYHH